MDKVTHIKEHYNFTKEDEINLKSLEDKMVDEVDDFVDAFYEYIKTFGDFGKFLSDKEVIDRHQNSMRQWFVELFDGDYGNAYFKGLNKVGQKHVQINLKAHYVNSAMHFVRDYVLAILPKVCSDKSELPFIKRSVEKIIDMNLDVFTSSYIEEERNIAEITDKLEGYLISFAKKFSYGLNIILVLGLVFLGVMVMGLFAYDLTHVFQGNIEKGLLSTLGTLLMLWVVIELVETEIKHLKGAKFTVNVFISVALVAVIRKILVTSLSSENVEAQLSLIAAVAVLGVVYWLIAKVEKEN